uniref:Immunoglobulin V-set domain-containing protein n=1 Tax=Pygocentrus nattereri TaxID=42514 RepID=A0A3B4C237_PYGNA
LRYTGFASSFSMVSAQTGVILEACGNQEVLEMMCKINSTSINTCIYYSKEKVVVSSGGVPPQDSTYKDRAKIVKTDKVCKLTLTGLEDHNQTFTCTINDFKPVLKTVNKSIQVCTAFSFFLSFVYVPAASFLLPLACLLHPFAVCLLWLHYLLCRTIIGFRISVIQNCQLKNHE